MSLFPAYANDTSEKIDQHQVAEHCGESLALEAQLLASDNDDEYEGGSHTVPIAPCQSFQLPDCDYYVDCKLDVGNLRVSTLYYPGRPQYNTLSPREALGDAGAGATGGRRRARRYYSAGASQGASSADASFDAELAQRTRAYRDMLAENPTDESLWLRFIEFQELTRGAEAALAAADEAATRLAEAGAGARRLRAALHRARVLALSPLRRLDLLRRDLALAAGAPDSERIELWLRVVSCAADVGGAELDAAAGAALQACRGLPRAYPHLLYAYGAALRAAAHWERLVLLLELALSMNFPPAAFPPRPDPAQLADQEQRLQHFEDKVLGSGLPLSTVWVRVERARAAVHWRAPAAGAAPPEDPQRLPLAADVAHLLQPAGAAAPLLVVQALRLAKVPLLPLGQYVLRAADAAADALGDAAEADGAEALMALVRAARRLPAAAAARGEGAARLVAQLVEPPHYFSDAGGFLQWLRALWEAACEWLAGDWREAVLCWRLRWLHALLLLLDPQDEAGRSEARRIRSEARAAVKRWARTALPYALCARIERAAAGALRARRAATAALRAATAALRAANADAALPPHHRLYVARVVCEVCDDEAVGEWAVACAALGRALPPDAELSARPPRDLLHAALQACEVRCARLELELPQAAAPAADCDGLLAALLPAPAEWAAARVALSSPARRAALLATVLGAADGDAAGGAAQRYWEQAGAALLCAAAREGGQAGAARQLAPLFPHNAFIALASGGAPLWAWPRRASVRAHLAALRPAARSHRAALAALLPALLGAARADWAPAAAGRAARAAGRLCRASGPAVLHAARLHAEARAERPAAGAALLAALEAHPQHKWLAVRGAAAVPAQAAALADVLLERQLRVHALPEELAPPRAPLAPTTAS